MKEGRIKKNLADLQKSIFVLPNSATKKFSVKPITSTTILVDAVQLTLIENSNLSTKLETGTQNMDDKVQIVEPRSFQ